MFCEMPKAEQRPHDKGIDKESLNRALCQKTMIRLEICHVPNDIYIAGVRQPMHHGGKWEARSL